MPLPPESLASWGGGTVILLVAFSSKKMHSITAILQPWIEHYWTCFWTPHPGLEQTGNPALSQQPVS